MVTCPKCHSDEIADYVTQNTEYYGYKICLKCFYLWKPKPQPEETEENEFDAFNEDPDSSNAEEDDYPAIF